MKRRVVISAAFLAALYLLWIGIAPAWFGLVHTPAQVWITSSSPRPPPWGTHAQSYALHREEYVRRVTDFLDSVFASRAN